MDSIAILDFGSQYAQLIARKLPAKSISVSYFPGMQMQTRSKIHPKGFILSGGPSSVYDPDAPKIPDFVLQSRLPILGICYGMQALTFALGGSVKASITREYGKAELKIHTENPLISIGTQKVWMSHGDRIEQMPKGLPILPKAVNLRSHSWVTQSEVIMGYSFIQRSTIRQVGN